MFSLQIVLKDADQMRYFKPEEDCLPTEGLFSMLSQLRQLAHEIKDAAVQPVPNNIKLPFIKTALHRNIHLYFRGHDISGVCRLYEQLLPWIGIQKVDFFRQNLTVVADTWFQDARKHPKLNTWTWTYHANIIKVWTRHS